MQGMVAKCAEMIGGAQVVLEMTNSYAKERVQYGQPIGGFQAIQHYLADMWADVETAKSITYEAVWRVSDGLPDAADIAAIAKCWVNQAYKRVTAQGVQIHGAIGVTRDHDIGLYYRRAKAAELAFGDSDFHRKRIAAHRGL